MELNLCSFYIAAMEMKAVKEEIAEEEDDDVPGKDGNNECLNLMEELEVLLIKASVKHYLCTFYQVCLKKTKHYIKF